MSDIDVKQAAKILQGTLMHKPVSAEELAPELVRAPGRIGKPIPRNELSSLFMPGAVEHTIPDLTDDRHLAKPSPLTDRHGLTDLDLTALPPKVCAHAKERMGKALGDKPHGGVSHREFKKSLRGL